MPHPDVWSAWFQTMIAWIIYAVIGSFTLIKLNAEYQRASIERFKEKSVGKAALEAMSARITAVLARMDISDQERAVIKMKQMDIEAKQVEMERHVAGNTHKIDTTLEKAMAFFMEGPKKTTRP